MFHLWRWGPIVEPEIDVILLLIDMGYCVAIYGLMSIISLEVCPLSAIRIWLGAFK